MQGKISRWLAEEDRRLKELKEEQNLFQEINWKKISIALNLEFGSNKTSKQCRQRYINYLKITKTSDLYQGWSDAEISKFSQLYLQLGSAWKDISSIMISKSQNNVKNKFNNGLRKALKKLNSVHLVQIYGRRKYFDFKILISLIDFSNKLLKKINQTSLQWSSNCEVYKFRTLLIKFCFHETTCSSEDINELVRNITKINYKLRSFGVYKVKTRKNWKITDQCFNKFVETCISEDGRTEAVCNLDPGPLIEENKNSSTIEFENESQMENDLQSLLLEMPIQRLSFSTSYMLDNEDLENKLNLSLPTQEGLLDFTDLL